jgi:hypothetical protein
LFRILERGMSLGSPSPASLQGLYLAATGAEKQTEQAFLSGLMPQVLEMQNGVTWSPEAVKRDRLCRLYTRLGYAAFSLTLVAIAAAIVWAAR